MEYVMNRYLRRWFANTFGPPLLTLTYSLIVRYYLCVPPVNGVIDPPLISAGFVYYAWLIFSIFALDWAKSALAGFEAWALMGPRFAPPTALHLMWHTDRAWGSVSGWRDAIIPLCMGVRHRFSKQPTRKVARGPAGLWWFLAFSSLLFYAAIPLSSLTMEMQQVYKLSTRKITIVGPNETTFDVGNSNTIVEQASNRWRLGHPTTKSTPYGETILYDSDGDEHWASDFYSGKTNHTHDATSANVLAGEQTFFSGPKVWEQADGIAWGLLTTLTCSVLSPVDQKFKLLKVNEIDNWTAPGLTSSDYGTELFKQRTGLSASLFDDGASLGISYAYLIASDKTASGGNDYTDISSFPTNGSLEVVLWQAWKAQSISDDVLGILPFHHAVTSSLWVNRSTTYLGFGVRCSVNSSTGLAYIHADSKSYSDFIPKASVPQASSLPGFNGPIAYHGMPALQKIVFASFTTAVLNVQAPLICPNSDDLSSATCNPWYGANVATGQTPYHIYGDNDPRIQFPPISPEEFRWAVQKIFAEVARAMMAQGGVGWKGGLYGTTEATALVPGKVPWSVVLTLLILWTAVTSIPSLWVFGRKRWADTLSGFDMFRFGAEWKEAVWQFEENEFEKCPILLEVPGMIGDMEANVMDTGFIGLSKDEARKNGSFVFARDAVI
ncbi:hypothetical protein D6D28_06334 [Aureobasidium pullulans]|uniref:Uncharacterized protein n=1 Tax=Aureobasidium pullulans TaxID=5580 RepID=A0A4S8SES4_AURPU|nr:hypothetical protein D6D28_06334 [Aureobasidium pullulans]